MKPAVDDALFQYEEDREARNYENAVELICFFECGNKLFGSTGDDIK